MARTYRLTVEDGIVACPWFGDIDVERCLQCPALRDADPGQPVRLIECRPRRSTADGLASALGGYVDTGARI